MGDAATYDNSKTYNVKLARPVNYRRSRLLPLHHHEMSGRVLNIIVEAEGKDVVDAAEVIE